jgi:opine dehydrogenase
MLNQPIAVLGGGNIAHTMAADLSLAGYEINFYEHPQFEDSFKATLEKGKVEIEDQKTSRHEIARIRRVTTDMKEAISDVKLIFMALPAFGQELFFNIMIPHLKDGQVVFLMTGNFGSLRLRKLLIEKAINRKITIYETNTMPYGVRLVGPAKVSVLYGYGPWIGTNSLREGLPKPSDITSALPAKDTDAAIIREFQKLYHFLSPTENVLVVALNNPNLIGHPAGSVLNAGRIEYANLYLKAEFRLHREGHTPSVQRVEDSIADEIASLVKALGGKRTPLRGDVGAYFEYCQTHPTSIQPRTLKDRYITEDVPYGLVPTAQLGEKFDVAMPITNSIIDLASVLNQEDYRKTGRTLETLGLANLSKKQILNLVEQGI